MTYLLKDVKILLVEDLHPILEITKSVLLAFGFKRIYTAKSGEHAFKVFCEENPDIVITDWVMENGDGIELIDNIRRHKKSPNHFVPVILLTGYSNFNRVELARDYGVTEILTKPYTANDLYKRLVQVIENPRQFVKAKNFFGPDRRRKKQNGYDGDFKRKRDFKELSAEQEGIANKLIEQMIIDTKQI